MVDAVHLQSSVTAVSEPEREKKRDPATVHAVWCVRRAVTRTQQVQRTGSKQTTAGMETCLFISFKYTTEDKYNHAMTTK